MDSRWTEPALQGEVRQGLNDKLRDALALRARPWDLNSLISITINLECSACGGQTDAAGPSQTHSFGEAKAFRFQGLSVLGPVGPLHRLLPHSAKRLSSPVHAGVLTSGISTCPTSSCLTILGTLLWANDSLPVFFLVDSGVDDSFINESLAKQASIPTEMFPQPKTIMDLDSQPITRVTHRTVPLTLIISSNHREQIHLFNGAA